MTHSAPAATLERATLTPTPKLIALDMDGTLLGLDARVSPRNLAALQRAQAAGILIVIATGRRHCYAMRALRNLGLSPKTLIVSSNGAVTRTIDAHLLHRTFLPIPTATWLCSHLEGFRETLVLTFDRVGPDGEDTRGALVVERLDHLHNSIARWMEVNAPYIAHINPLELSLAALSPDEAPIQAMLCGTIPHMRRAEARLLQHEGVTSDHSDHAALPPQTSRVHTHSVAIHRTEYPDRDLCIVDILPAGCSKGHAITRLAAGHSIPRAQVLAIGDNWNDVSMLEAAGQAALMSNAPADLLAHAATRPWQLLPAHHEDGVAHLLESFL